MNVIIAGGGTGGHLFPGIAIAEELRSRGVKNILFVGTEEGIESRVIPREGYQIRYIHSSGIVGKSIKNKVKGLLNLFISFTESMRLIKRFKPDVIIGVGGYASVAPLIAGSLRGVSTIILEQNSVPGLANRFLSIFGDLICITYHEGFHFFPKRKTILTGNPVRKRIFDGTREGGLRLFSLDPGRFTIFVFGGSRGASSINNAMVSILPDFVPLWDNVQFLHQTGEKDYEYVRESYRKYGLNGVVTPFIYQMHEAYAVADIVISRAGATTITEITSLGKPSILIPYPFAAQRHQEINARKLSEMGAALMLLDDELRGNRLFREIMKLYENEKLREELRKNAMAFSRRDAASKVVELIENLINSKKNRG